jgi:hypothetical protein
LFGVWFGVGVWGEMGESGVDCPLQTNTDNNIWGNDMLYARLSLQSDIIISLSTPFRPESQRFSKNLQDPPNKYSI